MIIIYKIIFLLPDVANIPPMIPQRRTKNCNNGLNSSLTLTLRDERSYLTNIPGTPWLPFEWLMVRFCKTHIYILVITTLWTYILYHYKFLVIPLSISNNIKGKMFIPQKKSDLSLKKDKAFIPQKGIAVCSPIRVRHLSLKKEKLFVPQQGQGFCPPKRESGLSPKKKKQFVPQKVKAFVPHKGKAVCPSKRLKHLSPQKENQQKSVVLQKELVICS